jgi:hypothetical protein
MCCFVRVCYKQVNDVYAVDIMRKKGETFRAFRQLDDGELDVS